MAKLRIGLVGCGGIGRKHAESWLEVVDGSVVAVCDPDAARAAEVAGLSGATVCAGIEALLAHPGLDAVDICTPPNLHAAVAIQSARRGLPVLCEKPLARTPVEAAEMVAAAATAGTLLMTAFCHRFHPPVLAVRQMIADGALGRVVMVRNRFGARFEGVEQRWFSNAEIAGGGTLMDTAVHSIDLFRFLVGEVREVSGAIATFHPSIHGVEDSAVMLLTAESGTLGVIEASWVTPGSANIVEIYGDRGAAEIDYNTGITRVCDASGRWSPIKAEGDSRFVTELRHFAAVIRGEAAPLMTGEDGARAVELIHAVYRGARV